MLHKSKTLRTTLVFLGIVFIMSLFMSCEGLYSDEDVNTVKVPASDIVSNEYISVQTVDQNSMTAQYVVIDPSPLDDELYLIVIPQEWNGELILYAHGYVAASVPNLSFEEGQELAALAASLGFAFATTTYKANGLHIQQGIDNILALRNFTINFLATNLGAAPNYIYLAGGSQGGAVATLTLERNPDAFDGGFSLCSPCGDFAKQLNYYGDFRLIFDYYFKPIVEAKLAMYGLPYPQNFDNIPPEVIAYWNVYVAIIAQTLQENPALTEKLMAVSEAPYDKHNPQTIGETVIATLWYNFFTVDDAKLKIDGEIFNNLERVYAGTGSKEEDQILNQGIQRLQLVSDGAYPLSSYETTGMISDPLVMRHTTKDPIQLFMQQKLYRHKVILAGNANKFVAIPIVRYGHCNFTDTEIVIGLNQLVEKVKGQELMAAQSLLNSGAINGKLVASINKLD